MRLKQTATGQSGSEMAESLARHRSRGSRQTRFTRFNVSRMSRQTRFIRFIMSRMSRQTRFTRFISLACLAKPDSHDSLVSHVSPNPIHTIYRVSYVSPNPIHTIHCVSYVSTNRFIRFIRSRVSRPIRKWQCKSVPHYFLERI